MSPATVCEFQENQNKDEDSRLFTKSNTGFFDHREHVIGFYAQTKPDFKPVQHFMPCLIIWMFQEAHIKSGGATWFENISLQ